MKKLYLREAGQGWTSFQYENINDLKDELEKRNIFIGYGVRIGYGAIIGDNAIIGDGARIGYGAIIGDNARIGDGARIGDNARIGDGASPKTIFINGSQHPVSWWGEDAIQIGCMKKTITEWEEQYKEIGEDEDYEPEQIEEYARYIQMCKAMYEAEKQPENPALQEIDKLKV